MKYDTLKFKKFLEEFDQSLVIRKTIDLLDNELGHLNENYFSTLSLGILTEIIIFFIYSYIEDNESKSKIIDQIYNSMKELLENLKKEEIT